MNFSFVLQYPCLKGNVKLAPSCALLSDFGSTYCDSGESEKFRAPRPCRQARVFRQARLRLVLIMRLPRHGYDPFGCVVTSSKQMLIIRVGEIPKNRFLALILCDLAACTRTGFCHLARPHPSLQLADFVQIVCCFCSSPVRLAKEPSP